MMQTLADAFSQAMNDGYAGLWASGDMTWEIGGDKDFSRLLEYEWRLEEFFAYTRKWAASASTTPALCPRK